MEIRNVEAQLRSRDQEGYERSSPNIPHFKVLWHVDPSLSDRTAAVAMQRPANN
jgi:hypothetical protein